MKDNSRKVPKRKKEKHMQQDDIVDNMTEEYAKSFLEWLFLKNGCMLVPKSECIYGKVMTYYTSDIGKPVGEHVHPYEIHIIYDSERLIRCVHWPSMSGRMYRGVLKQLFSGHDIYLFWDDDSRPFISKDDSLEELLVKYDLEKESL